MVHLTWWSEKKNGFGSSFIQVLVSLGVGLSLSLPFHYINFVLISTSGGKMVTTVLASLLCGALFLKKELTFSLLNPIKGSKFTVTCPDYRTNPPAAMELREHDVQTACHLNYELIFRAGNVSHTHMYLVCRRKKPQNKTEAGASVLQKWAG